MGGEEEILISLPVWNQDDFQDDLHAKWFHRFRMSYMVKTICVKKSNLIIKAEVHW